MAADEQLGRTANRERNAFSATGRTVYFHEDGRIKATGDRVVNPDLARTLERVAKGGADIFYTGEIAEEIDADMRANGGLMTAADLASYRTARAEPIWTGYRDWRVASNRPPGGGVQVLQILNQLEHFDLAAIGHNSTEYLRVVTEAMKRATRDKDAHVGDPAFYDVPVDWLLSREYGAKLAGEIGRGERAEVTRVAYEPPDTTHVVAVDREGGIVTMTHSLGMPSGLSRPGSASCTTVAWLSSIRGPAGRGRSRPARAGFPRSVRLSSSRATGPASRSARRAARRSRWA